MKAFSLGNAWLCVFMVFLLIGGCTDAPGPPADSTAVSDIMQDTNASPESDTVQSNPEKSDTEASMDDVSLPPKEDVTSGEDGAAAEADMATEALDVVMPESDVADTQADAVVSDILDPDAGGEALPPCPEGAGADHVVKNLPYAGTDARNVLDLYLPADAGPLPLLIWVHGGGWKGGTKDTISQHIMDFLDRGYAIASIEYRLSDHPWPAPLADVKAAVRWLRAKSGNWGLDPDRFAALGSSAGGHLVAMLGVSEGVASLEDLSQGNPEVSSGVQVVVDYYGPTDLLEMDTDALAKGCPENALCHLCAGSPESMLVNCESDLDTCADKAVEASPVTWADISDVPFLIVHGVEDCTVPTPQSGRLHTKLLEAGVPSKLVEVEGAGHNVGECSTYDTRAAVREFLDTNLRGCMPEPEPYYENIDQCMEGECTEELAGCVAATGCMNLEQCFRENFGKSGYIAGCTNGLGASVIGPHKTLFDCAKPAGCYAMLQ